MEPITTVAIKIAENAYEVANEIKEISKDVYKAGESVLKIKKISESEGKEQIEAIGDFIKNDLGNLLNDVFIDEFPNSGLSESVLPNDVFIDEFPNSGLSESVLPNDVFIDEFPNPGSSESVLPKDVFIDEFPNPGSSESVLPNDVFIDEFPNPGLSESVLPNDVFIDEFPNSGLSESILPNDVSIDEFPGNDSLDELQKEDELNLVEKEESVIENKHESLTDQEKQEIKERTGWSDKIVDHIRTKEEAEIYIDAQLVEGEVNGKPALLQPNIDGEACNDPKCPDYSNKELAQEGFPPRDKSGRPLELHHIGQNPDSPLAELTYEQHRGNGNFKILHTFEDSSIDRIEFNKERKEYWIERSKSL